MLIIIQISLGNDPRPPLPPAQPAGDATRTLHNHNPWEHHHSDSDPEEPDIQEFIRNEPGDRVHFYSRTFTTRPRGDRNRPGGPNSSNQNESVSAFADIQRMMNGILGPGPGPGPRNPDQNGPWAFGVPPRGNPFPPPPGFGSQGHEHRQNGPNVIGGRFTFTLGPRPRGNEDGENANDDLATYANPESSPQPPSTPRTVVVLMFRGSPNELGRILSAVFGPPPQGADDQHTDQHAMGGLPPALGGLLAALMNPANAVAGDAVYSQEALDRIISTLMEQHPTSNAPGPAPAEAIAKLPKKKIDEKMLGPEMKAECSVCMDDVHLDDEVVVLPCTHWFHEACASAWLSEHNTCPICRTGITISEDTTNQSTSSPRRRSSHASPAPNDNSSNQSSRPRDFRRQSHNEARLESIRNAARTDPTSESTNSSTEPSTSETPSRRRNRSPSPPEMPGSYRFSSRRRGSDSEETPREYTRRGNTSGSDQSRRSSNSGNSGGGGGPFSWFRRFGSGTGSGSGSGNARRHN
jgi:E3 ubiquitin-protein ligase RNF115/126